jgi:hypothetical protein
MRMLLRSIVLAGVTAALMPLPAAAQVYPDRIVGKKDVRVVTATAYQSRDRSDSRNEQTERTTKTVHIGSDGSLDLANIAGDITVTRGGGSDATVEIVKTARGRDANDTRDLLSIVTVDVNERNGRAEIKAHYPSGDEQRRNGRRNLNVSIAYNVSAPANARVSIESISGNIKVTDIKGDVNANTISGDVKIAGASHISGAKSISGSIEVSAASPRAASTPAPSAATSRWTTSGPIACRRTVRAAPSRSRGRSRAADATSSRASPAKCASTCRPTRASRSRRARSPATSAASFPSPRTAPAAVR